MFRANLSMDRGMGVWQLSARYLELAKLAETFPQSILSSWGPSLSLGDTVG